MSKSDDLENDVGGGDWFRISYVGLNDDKTVWLADDQHLVRTRSAIVMR